MVWGLPDWRAFARMTCRDSFGVVVGGFGRGSWSMRGALPAAHSIAAIDDARPIIDPAHKMEIPRDRI